jgi:hypothetical protein
VPITNSNQSIGWIALVTVVVVLVVVLVLSLRTPPQMGPDEEVFNTVDALYTAVRNQDDQQLTACEVKLNGYREAGKLPTAAAESLAGIISKSRSGNWESAAKQLYDFMAAQKRDGFTPPAKVEKPKKK